jgi:hypothetical protein
MPHIEYAKTWNCRHCDTFYDSEQHPGAEVATVGGISLDPDNARIPHIRCPHCRECMGCFKKRLEPS